LHKTVGVRSRQQILEVRRQLDPANTTPMHHRTPALGLMGLMFAPDDKFLSMAGAPVKMIQELSVGQATLAENDGIVVMKYEVKIYPYL
jgi:hypothetical protein